MTGRANDDLQPLLVTAEEVELLRRFLRRKYRGSNGIRVAATPDVVDVGNALGLFPPLGLGGNGGVFSVRVKKDGGDGGSRTSPPTWTYGIWPLDTLPSEDSGNDARLAEQLEPYNRTPFAGQWSQAPDDSIGLAMLNPDYEEGGSEPQYVLLAALKEAFATQGCETGGG